MIRRDLTKINTKGMKERDAVKEVESFIESDACLNGNILVLYGLRRTGKTTILEQVLQKYKENYRCAFYEVEDSDDLQSVKHAIVEEVNVGTTLICFDEITKAEDFIINSAALPDVFAKEGIKIIVTGTDSLGFLFAENTELYDRVVKINTTYISFAEHCRVLGTKDVDDYVRYGGLMKKGANNNRIVYDYASACKYLDSAVAENISRSIQKDPEDSCLECLTLAELRAIIEKMVELYSGTLSTKVIQNDLKKVSVNYPVSKLGEIADARVVNLLTLESKEITIDFANTIGAGTKIEHKITKEMVETLEKYLFDMHVLSVTKQISFYYTKNLGWKEDNVKHEYYVIQPAIKFYHLQEGKRFIEDRDYYKELSYSEKLFMQNKLDEKIIGDVLEQIILFDVSNCLSEKDYFVCKPVFYVEGQRKGEYDMLVYDKEQNCHWAFEIKHTTEPFYLQEQHLQNGEFQEITETKFGSRKLAIVLYRGKSFVSERGSTYLNVVDFLLAMDELRSLTKVLSKLCSSSECNVMNAF